MTHFSADVYNFELMFVHTRSYWIGLNQNSVWLILLVISFIKICSLFSEMKKLWPPFYYAFILCTLC